MNTFIFPFLFKVRNSRARISDFKIACLSSNLFPFSILNFRSLTNATGQPVAYRTNHLYICHRNGYSKLYLLCLLSWNLLENYNYSPSGAWYNGSAPHKLRKLFKSHNHFHPQFPHHLYLGSKLG